MAARKRTPRKYRLLAKMNVRSAPSLDADIVSVLDAGAEVEVKSVRNEWLALTDGSFILYENGRFAERAGT